MSQEASAQADEKTMRLRYAGTCRRCGQALCTGTVAVYERTGSFGWQVQALRPFTAPRLGPTFEVRARDRAPGPEWGFSMYRYERALADEHIADMKRTADRFRLAKLAQCCTAVVRWFDSVRCRIRGGRGDPCDS